MRTPERRRRRTTRGRTDSAAVAMEAEELASLSELLAQQEATLAALKAARLADGAASSAELEDMMKQIPRYEEEARRIRAQMVHISSRMGKMNDKVKKLEAKRRSEIEADQRKEASLKPKE